MLAQARAPTLYDVEIVTCADRPDLEDEAGAAFRVKWPEFIFHDPVSRRHIERVEKYFGEYNILVLDEGRVVAGGWGVAFCWDGTVASLPEGYDGALVRSVEEFEKGIAPNTLSFMAAAVVGHAAGKRWSSAVLGDLTERAEMKGLDHVLAPLRPTTKHRYPLTPMAEFATWQRADGLSIDPWVRAHQRMGARVLAPAPRSMVITGSIDEWETWADMVFPVTGDYVVPEALNLVHIDREANLGTYEEENLWVQHR
jgi:hypothetical protein